ncbi:integral membrane protein [Hypoxylon rubiginosum]|uniref:Integral membrane protein n=1 Tax=Hypoxylon rubiginosum TaxID=110542 RepID=A0ACC0CMA9_9PEZI|nr:integral membrane protein [Hypoxylon rubiginosum]
MDATFEFPTEPIDRGLSSKAEILLALTWFFIAFAIQAVVLRFYLRRKFTQVFTLDDWIMLVALCVHILFQTFLTLTAVTGFGYPMETMTIQQIVDMSKWAWATVPANILANLTARLSIAIMLVTIFSVRRWFKWLIITYTSMMLTLGLGNFLFVFFQASPFPASWDFRLPADWRLPHLPHEILIFTQLLVFIISDFLYAFFPIFFIWKLNMATQKKIGLMVVMAGSFITMGAAIGRAVITSDTLNGSTEVSEDGTNPDKVFVTFGVTSLLASIEVSLLIILGSLPKLRVITKLSLFENISSSFSSMMSKLWPGTRSGVSKSRSNRDYVGSGVELNNANMRAFPNHPKGYHSSSITAVSTNPTRGSGQQEQEDRIRVTEGYAVIYDPKSQQPRTYV